MKSMGVHSNLLLPAPAKRPRSAVVTKSVRLDRASRCFAGWESGILSGLLLCGFVIEETGDPQLYQLFER
jgi:hypothetical protein